MNILSSFLYDYVVPKNNLGLQLYSLCGSCTDHIIGCIQTPLAAVNVSQYVEQLLPFNVTVVFKISKTCSL